MKFIILCILISLTVAPLTTALNCYACGGHKSDDETHQEGLKGISCGQMDSWDKVECSDRNQKCMTMTYWMQAGSEILQIVMRGCGTQDICNGFEAQQSSINATDVEVEKPSCTVCGSDYCNNAFRLGSMEFKMMTALATVVLLISKFI